MKKSNVKLLLVGACVLGALGMAGCGKKNYDTFPEKYSLASVDVGGMTAKEAKKAVKDAVKKYQIAVKLDDASFDMNADELGIEYNDKTVLYILFHIVGRHYYGKKLFHMLFSKSILYILYQIFQSLSVILSITDKLYLISGFDACSKH